jgi:hypothetical protein
MTHTIPLVRAMEAGGLDRLNRSPQQIIWPNGDTYTRGWRYAVLDFPCPDCGVDEGWSCDRRVGRGDEVLGINGAHMSRFSVAIKASNRLEEILWADQRHTGILGSTFIYTDSLAHEEDDPAFWMECGTCGAHEDKPCRAIVETGAHGALWLAHAFRITNSEVYR